MSRAVACLVVALCLPASASAAADPRSDQDAAKRALQRVQDLKHGIGVRAGRELTPALLDLELRLGALSGADRRDAIQLLARPTDGASDPQGDGYTVAEATPVCTAHFCVHYVTTTADAPPLADTNPANGLPDYVERMASVFENEVFPCENGVAAMGCAEAGSAGLGWPQAPSDGTRGGDGRFDVYLKQLGNQGIFGYVAPDPQPAGDSLFSYLVMDNDFSQAEFGYADPLVPMRVTAAHEYNHVLQFGIDALEDTWMFESTATYFEEKVYPAIDDYLNYLGTSSWTGTTPTSQPLTDASAGGGLKIYGSAVWNHFVAGRHGAGSILAAWQAKSRPVVGHSFAPGSYDTAIAANGGVGFASEFDDFAAAVAEWRAPGAGFPDLYPDVQRNGTLTVGAAGTTIKLNHTTFNFQNVAIPASSTALTLTATLPTGLEGAIALVGRTGGSTTAGTVTTQTQRIASGGAASVTLPNAETFGRITAVLVNADPSQSGFNNGKKDWSFTKDNVSFSSVRVTSGPIPPTVSTSPASAIAENGATLNGLVNPNGLSTTAWFEYGTTTAYGTETAHVSAGSGTAAVAQSAPVTGLVRGATYHYRAVAQNSSGTSVGADQTFTTLDSPVVATAAATGVAADGATLNATVDPRGQPTTYVFEYGTTTAYGSQVPLVPASAGSGTGPLAVAAVVGGLDPATTYHFRVVATNADGSSAGADRSFTTLAPPGVATGPAGAVGATGATLTGTVDPRGKSTSFTFEYGETTAYGAAVSGDAGGSSGPVSVASAVGGLAPGTVYHYRLTATSSDGTTIGQDAAFATLGVQQGQTGAGAGAPQGAAGARLTVTLTVSRTRLRTLLRKGLPIRVGCSATCRATLRLVVSRRTMKRLRLRKPTLATARVRVSGGTRARVRLRVVHTTRRRLGRARVVRARLSLSATDAGGERVALVRTLRFAR